MTSSESVLEAAVVPIETEPMLSLSVIMPNFNHGKLVPRALLALLNQQPAAKEIIVIDDGSADDSVEIIENFMRRYGSIKLIRNPINRGIVASFESAMAVATGDYVLFAAADDFVLPGLFRRAEIGLRENPEAAFFCSGVALLDDDARVIGLRPVTPPRRRRGFLPPAAVRRAIRNSDFWFIGTSAIFRRHCLAEIGYLDARLGSIGDTLTSRLLAFRHGFYFDPEVLAAYSKYPTSFSGRSALSVTNSRRLLDAADAWIGEKFPEDSREEQRRLFVRRMAFGFARLWVIWRKEKIDSNAIADILNLGLADRKALSVLSRVPMASGFLTLGWMTLRTPPFGMTAMAEAWWRALRFRWFGRDDVQDQVDRVCNLSAPTSDGGAGK